MAVKYLLTCMILAAYFQGIEGQGERGRSSRGGGGNWIVYVAVFGSVFILSICYSCIFTRCLCCGANQQAEVDTELKNVRNEKCSDEQLDQYMLELILLAEQAKLVAYLQSKQIDEQSSAGVQSRAWEQQMGYSQLNLDKDSPTTLNDTNITKETPMTSDVQREPWKQMRSPQLKLDTASLMTSMDADVTEKSPMTSYV